MVQPKQARAAAGLAAAIAAVVLPVWAVGRSHSLPSTTIFSASKPCDSDEPAKPCNCSQGSNSSGAVAATAVASAAASGEAATDAIGPEERSYYSKWIDYDLSHWNETGITQQMVDHAFTLARLCAPTIRIQVVNGNLYAEGAEPGAKGYYPQEYGPGWVSGKGRVPYILLVFMEQLHMFPDQTPDLDVVFQIGDYPCITRHGHIFDGRAATPPWISNPQDAELAAKEAAAAGFKTTKQREAAAAPPLLALNSRRGYRDIPFPDFSYWGHEVGTLNNEKGKWIYGWDAQLDHYVTRFGNVSLPQRWPQVIWRGRSGDARDELRRIFVGCYNYLEEHGQDPRVINLWENWGFPGIDLQNICNWRFVGYLESFAYSSSFKQKLACGSVVMTPIMEYYEFFGRELQPGVHYIEVSHKPGEMCEDISRNVQAMNTWLDEQKEAEQQDTQAAVADDDSGGHAGEEQGVGGAEADPGQHGRRLLGVWGYPPKKARDSYSNPWDSDLTPIEIAHNGRQFLLDHVRMRDARLYVRDLLMQYGKLQRFTPTPQPGSVRITGSKLLNDVALPHRVDSYHIAAQYPWLPYWGE